MYLLKNFILLPIILMGLNSSLFAEIRKKLTPLNYDCSFEIQMNEVVPESLYDTESDGIFRIYLELRTNIKRRRPYSVTITKIWPILENNSSIFQAKLRASNLKVRRRNRRRKRIFRLLNLKFPGPLNNEMEAKYRIFNRELYNEKPCQSCSKLAVGNCFKLD